MIFQNEKSENDSPANLFLVTLLCSFCLCRSSFHFRSDGFQSVGYKKQKKKKVFNSRNESITARIKGHSTECDIAPRVLFTCLLHSTT